MSTRPAWMSPGTCAGSTIHDVYGWADDDAGDWLSSRALPPSRASFRSPTRSSPRGSEDAFQAEDLIAMTVVVAAQIAWISALALVAVALPQIAGSPLPRAPGVPLRPAADTMIGARWR